MSGGKERGWLNRTGHVIVPVTMFVMGLSMTSAGVYLWLRGVEAHTATLGVIFFRIIAAPLGVIFMAVPLIAAFKDKRSGSTRRQPR